MENQNYQSPVGDWKTPLLEMADVERLPVDARRCLEGLHAHERTPSTSREFLRVLTYSSAAKELLQHGYILDADHMHCLAMSAWRSLAYECNLIWYRRQQETDRQRHVSPAAAERALG